MCSVLFFCVLLVISKAYINGPTPVTWTDGENLCQGKHSHLATIKNADDSATAQTICEQNFAEGETEPGCWIGLFLDNGKWKWSNPTSDIDYGFDSNGDPVNGIPWSDSPGTEDCVVLDKTDDYKWITIDCDDISYPLCNLRKHVFLSNCSSYAIPNGCTEYNDNYWEKKGGTWGEPVYFTNGVVVALTGTLSWKHTTNARMGTLDDGLIINITNINDAPYFDEVFSVTNADGVDCVIKVSKYGVVSLESWSLPIVYVSTDNRRFDRESWYINGVEQLDGNPEDAEIFYNLYDGENMGMTLDSVGWVTLDGIVWVSQGSGLDDTQSEAIEFKTKKEKKDKSNDKCDSSDDSLVVLVSLVMIGCGVFGLCGGIGIKLVSLRTNNVYYAKLVNSETECSS